jgi:quinol monooxygenase YgiN
MYVVTVTFELEEGGFEAFRSLIATNAAESRKEAGCRQFDVCFSEDRRRCFLYEVYTDRAAFDFHHGTAHFLAFDTKARPLFTSKKAEFWALEARTP